MTQKIALGISEKIKTAYPEEKYKIYAEEVEQGYLKPCFFVLPSNINHKRMINNRFKSKYSFSISAVEQQVKTNGSIVLPFLFLWVDCLLASII